MCLIRITLRNPLFKTGHSAFDLAVIVLPGVQQKRAAESWGPTRNAGMVGSGGIEVQLWLPGRRVLALGMAGSCPLSASPQCQPTTDAKENNLKSMEHLSPIVIPVEQVGITGRNYGLIQRAQRETVPSIICTA